MVKKNSLKLYIFLFLIFILIFSQTQICDKLEIKIKSSEDANNITIQELIDKAEINEIISINPGIYKETISINKSITLVGKDKNKTIIDTNFSNYYSIIIKASYVDIRGFTIQNGTVGIYIEDNKSINNCNLANNIFINNLGGIYLGRDSNNNSINNNNFTANDGEGIRLYESNQNLIFNNTIRNQNNYGIVLWEISNSNKIFNNIITDNRNGIGIRRWSDQNLLTNNNITNNKNSGISISYSFNNNISNNYLQDNTKGISIGDSSYNLIFKNYFNNNAKGIYLYDAENNTIVENNIFINNDIDISEGSKKFKTSSFELFLVLFAILFLFMINKKMKNF